MWDCDCTLPLEYEDSWKGTAYLTNPKNATKVYAPTGSTWSTIEFYCDVDKFENNSRINHIGVGQTKNYSASNGRSSENKAPFFNIHKKGKGYIFAIGWSGQWNCSITRDFDSVTFKSKIEDTCFRLMPGESIRTSSIVILPYEGDFDYSQNLWRKLVKTEFSPIGKGDRPEYAPIAASIWGGMTTNSALERIKTIADNDLPFDCVWMDAGWYGIDTPPSPDEFEGPWAGHTGDWVVSPLIHPNELKDISKAIHDSGRKFLLWFEPERVVRGTPIDSQHPEYLISGDDPYNCFHLLDLGKDEVWNYCFNMLSEKIESLNIDWLRIDFNFGPLQYWRNNDYSDRQGICEIKYVTGLYKLWDALLEKFPHLLIDNCASGERRIDIETLKRSVPLWRSDYQCPANYDIVGAQCHNQCFNSWMPYSGTGTEREFDEYRIRSSYTSSIMCTLMYSEKEPLANSDE